MSNKPFCRRIGRWLARRGITARVPNEDSGLRRFGKASVPFLAALLVPLVYTSLSASGALNMETAYVLCIIGWVISTFAFILAQWCWRFPRHRIIAGLAFSVMSAYVFYSLASYEARKRYELTHITPDNITMPDNICSFKGFIIMMGSVVDRITHFPTDVISIGNDENGIPFQMLQIDREGDNISISILRIFSDKEAITTIHSDKIWENSHFRVERPTPHRLMAYNEQDEMVLDLNFLNKTTLTIEGKFKRNGREVDISKEKISYGHSSAGHMCINGCAIQFYLGEDSSGVCHND
jgi:hypothetical protein